MGLGVEKIVENDENGNERRKRSGEMKMIESGDGEVARRNHPKVPRIAAGR